MKQLAQAYALPVYLVGGPVRDWLMGRQVRDLDFVVEGDAPFLARVLAQRVNGRVIVHDRFGTATLELDGVKTDLVTARKEVYPVPGALPEVEPSTLRDDLARRDFTINAMALPLGGGLEELLDPFGGMDDLREGLVRTIHPQSFSDDPTRLFRAVRYEQRFGFRLAEETSGEFTAEVEQRGCDRVSGDRVRRELELIFCEQRPDMVLLRAAKLGLLSALVPGLAQAEGVARWAARLGDGMVEEGDASISWLAALAYPLSSTGGEFLVRRLNVPRRWAGVVRSSVALRNLESTLVDEDLPLSALARLLEGHDARTIRVVSMITDSPGAARNLARFLDDGAGVKPMLKGDDLLAMGVPPGPMVGKMLADLRDMRMDRRINSEEEERQWVNGQVTSQGCQ